MPQPCVLRIRPCRAATGLRGAAQCVRWRPAGGATFRVTSVYLQQRREKWGGVCSEI